MKNFFSQTQFIGKDIIYMPTCHSTNDIAADLYKKNQLNVGTVVMTGHQMSGRGQRGNSWEAAPGKNITCSIVFSPSFLELTENFYLNIFSSLGIVDYLSKLDENFKIKWPNDIFFKNRKICGLLVENTIKGQAIASSILGIGLNVNQVAFETPDAISLANIFNHDFHIDEVLGGICEFIEKRFMQLESYQFDELKKDYLKRMYWLQEKHTFYANDYFEGSIIGISPSGKLQIETIQGIREFAFKEVKFIS